jgi:hypothetical protein
VNTLEYDGSSWTTGNNYPTILANGGGSGVLTAGIMAAGYTPADSSGKHSCTYDGTNWTQVADLNNVHQEHGFAQQSPNSATLNFGANQIQMVLLILKNGMALHGLKQTIYQLVERQEDLLET